jgi:hypothetical protein
MVTDAEVDHLMSQYSIMVSATASRIEQGGTACAVLAVVEINQDRVATVAVVAVPQADLADLAGLAGLAEPGRYHNLLWLSVPATCGSPRPRPARALADSTPRILGFKVKSGKAKSSPAPWATHCSAITPCLCFFL